MPGVKNSKLKLLVLADILEKQTDEEHPPGLPWYG
jgi:hypothetical protein